jgi:hypothetical protein
MRLPALALLGVLGCSSTPTSADAGGEDATRTDTAVADMAMPDAARGRYWQWEYPQCQSATGSCPAGCDTRSSVAIAPTKCGPFVDVSTGACFPNTVLLAGWSCFRRISDGEVIVYYYRPYTTEGLEACPENAGYPIGSLPPPGNLCPADGGADSD